VDNGIEGEAVKQTLKLAGKVCLVTGAGGKPSDSGAFGTGKAIATLFAREGARVVIVDRHQDRADHTKRHIEQAGGEAVVVVANLATEADCKRVVDQAVSAFGRLDILVNNAAVCHIADVLETTAEMLEESILINLTVPFLLTKAALPIMIGNGGGAIVNISSIATMRDGSVPAYAAAKAGMEALTRSTACTYGRRGIRANAVVVGSVDTPLRRATVPGEYKPRKSALPTEGNGWDIAQAALFLASDDAAHITAVMLPVDSGATALTPGN